MFETPLRDTMLEFLVLCFIVVDAWTTYMTLSELVLGLCEGALESDHLQKLGKVLRFRVQTLEASFWYQAGPVSIRSLEASFCKQAGPSPAFWKSTFPAAQSRGCRGKVSRHHLFRPQPFQDTSLTIYIFPLEKYTF